MGNSKRRDIKQLASAVISGDRTSVGQSLTLVESTNPSDREDVGQLLESLSEHTGDSLRIGVTGIPGAGKSTLINVLGKQLVEDGYKVAVLAVDPSSSKSGGSILGDKTRMEDIANLSEVFIRPSPTDGASGGITRASRESIAVLEAAGYDIVFLETVGSGQSELKAADVVDILVLVAIPGAGDELQGIKRGIMELVDMVLVNKVDINPEAKVKAAVNDFVAALHLLHTKDPVVLPVSATTGTGIKEVVEVFTSQKAELENTTSKRTEQKVKSLGELIERTLLEEKLNSPESQKLLKKLEGKIAAGELTPTEAAQKFFEKS